MTALAITGLQKRFGGVVALAGVDVSIDLDRIVGIIGPNGSGKTTLFNVVTGVHRPTAGQVVWQGVDITAKPAHRITRMGLVRTFQQAMSFKSLSVNENIGIAWDHGLRHGRTGARRWRSPEELRRFVGLSDRGEEIAGAMPFGNLRRLGIAIALAANPALVLLDEPAAGLSERETEELIDLIRELPKLGIGVCLIDHHMTMMSALCARLIVFNFGNKIAEGPPELVLNDPKVMEVYLGTTL
jgi:branched-chain amino acid transport system ATP-binding protein